MKKRTGSYFTRKEPLPDRRQEQELWDQLPNDAGQSDEFWQDTWNNIRRQRKRQTLLVRMKQVAVAAAVSGLLLGAYYWFGVTHSTPKPPAIAADTYKTIHNSTNDAMDVMLEDSTLVTLFPAGELRYKTGSTPGKREVYLEGSALFNVQHAENNPFTVFSNGLATTVLGTTFKVTGTKETHHTSIYLYKGKVVVKSANPEQVKLNKDYYLQPGDVFRYDHQQGLAALDKPKHPVVNTTAATANTPDAVVSNWYMFENQELAQVLDQLSAIWNVPIHYNPADLQGLNFIGKIERTDTLVNVLKDIALLNNLTVVNNGKNYSIKKK